MTRRERKETPELYRSGLSPAAEATRAAAGDGRPVAPARPTQLESTPKEFLHRLKTAAVIVDRDHRICATNRRGASLFAGQRLAGRRCYEVLHHRRSPCDGNATRCPVERLHDREEPCREIHVHRGHRGAEHHEITAYPLTLANGTAVSCLELRPIAVASARPSPSGLVGRSSSFNHMLALVLRAAPHRIPVLLLGETGTGRESVARALHQLGPVPDGRFVVMHSSGLSGYQFSTELHRSPATSIGLSDQSTLTKIYGGTLYLAEIGALALPAQGQLLRLLTAEDRLREEGSTSLSLGLRLVCGANQGLHEEVVQGSFLADLYYRLNIFPILIPPLRERRGDLRLLVESLLSRPGHSPPLEIHPRTLAILEHHPLPGNLRELGRILEFACLQADSGVIMPDHLPPKYRSEADTQSP